MSPSRAAHCFQIICDFDGTITLDDATDLIFNSFADPKWLEFEREWTSGRMSSHQCLSQQVGLIRADRRALETASHQVRIDPDFGSFVQFCADHHIPLTIASDGFEDIINFILRRYDIDVPIRANNIAAMSADEWVLRTPYKTPSCVKDSANCKCQSVIEEPLRHIILIGDGHSDICLAQKAHMVFAKQHADKASPLFDFCEANQLPHIGFHSFADILVHMQKMLAME